MDDSLGANDPYRNMNTGQQEITPGFLRRGNTGERNKQAAANLKAGEGQAVGGYYKRQSGVQKAANTVGAVARAATAKSKGIAGGKKGKAGKGLKMSKGLPAAGIAIALIGVMIMLVVAVPMFLIGAIDYGLQKLGFGGEILEEQAEYVVAEMLANGEVPKEYASDLAANGIDVGQLTVAGDFVKTNVYIANLEELGTVAATGEYELKAGAGELAVKFGDSVIKAGDFVAAVEADPVLYAAYEKATDIVTRYYYSDEVDAVYKEMGLSRSAFGKWEKTGDAEADQESFDKILAGILDNDAGLTVNGYDIIVGLEGIGASFVQPMNSGAAGELVSDVADETKKIGDEAGATKSAAELLNMAVSSSEPYRAASAFMAVEEPLQRARIDGDGPVNELMNTLAKSTELTYVDVNTGEEKTVKTSILDTRNFAATVGDGTYSREEAANFSRDRVLGVTGQADTATINDTTIDSNGSKFSNVVLGVSLGDSANLGILEPATDSLRIAVSEKNADLFQTVVGGNRIVEGGSFIATTIDTRVIGAMPSSAEVIARYDHEIKEVIARRAEADRATLSPFDASSPYTFMGSLVRKLGAAMLGNGAASGLMSATTAVNTMGDLVGDAVANLAHGALADGKESSFLTTSGDNCVTVENAAKVEGNLYCSSINTVSTKYMSNTTEDWEREVNAGEFRQFVTLAMDREATVGVKSSNVCDRYKDLPGNSSLLSAVGDFLAKLAGIYNACRNVPQDIATGAYYTLSENNSAETLEKVEKYSGYALHEEVKSLLGGGESRVAQIRRDYYAEHPRDDSVAGKIARRSGLTTDEAQVALAYAGQLVMAMRYDASTRYAFGTPVLKKMDALALMGRELNENIYLLWCGKAEYMDVRNRTFVI